MSSSLNRRGDRWAAAPRCGAPISIFGSRLIVGFGRLAIGSGLAAGSDRGSGLAIGSRRGSGLRIFSRRISSKLCQLRDLAYHRSNGSSTILPTDYRLPAWSSKIGAMIAKPQTAKLSHRTMGPTQFKLTAKSACSFRISHRT